MEFLAVSELVYPKSVQATQKKLKIKIGKREEKIIRKHQKSKFLTKRIRHQSCRTLFNLGLEQY